MVTPLLLNALCWNIDFHGALLQINKLQRARKTMRAEMQHQHTKLEEKNGSHQTTGKEHVCARATEKKKSQEFIAKESHSYDILFLCYIEFTMVC